MLHMGLQLPSPSSISQNWNRHAATWFTAALATLNLSNLEPPCCKCVYSCPHQAQLVKLGTAVLQIGFFGAFRCSELVSIQWEHIDFVPEGVEIFLPKSKTDQEGKGQVCAIPYGKDANCPVLALKNWQTITFENFPVKFTQRYSKEED